MKRTSLARLAGLALGTYLVFWPLDLLLLELFGGFVPIGVSATILIALSAQALAVWGWSIRNRLPKTTRDDAGKPLVLRAKNPLPPLVAARTLAIALAASRVGSLCTGAYGGMATAAALNLQLQISVNHVLVAGATVVVSILLSMAGLWVERLCTLPPSSPGAEGEPA